MSDMNLTQAADEIRKMLRGFKAVEQVSAALESVGSIQNAGKEAEKALESVKAEINKAQQDLIAASTEVLAAKDEAKKIAADAKAKAAERLEKANADANRIVADAQSKADAEVVRLSSIQAQAQIEAAKRDAAAAELAEIEQKITKVKAQAAKLLGA